MSKRRESGMKNGLRIAIAIVDLQMGQLKLRMQLAEGDAELWNQESSRHSELQSVRIKLVKLLAGEV